MAKFVCSVCGYVHEDLTAPENCPVCMASSSDFTEVEEVPQTEKLQADNNVGIEAKINETEVRKNVESHAEEDSQYLEASNEADKSISNNINDNIISDAAVSGVDKVDSDEEEIVKKYKATAAALQVVKWYMETYHVGLKEAKDRVDFVLDKHGLRKASKGGCMVTILIAISSTLSVFFLL